jgi:hypothetical protein
MKLRNAGRLVVTSTAAVLAISVMSGALATTVERFNYCMENQPDTESVTTRISCCKEAGGAWVEIYDADGNVIDGFCDGAEEVWEPDEVRRPLPTIDPAALDHLISGSAVVVSSDPTPAPASSGEAERTVEPASSDGAEETSSDPAPASGEEISSDPAPASDEEIAPAPAPEPKKGKGKHKHRRHRRR